MQPCTQLLGQASIGRLADEGVSEPPPTAGFVLRLKQTASFEGDNCRLEGFRGKIWGERPKRAEAEPAALHRCSLEDEPRCGLEAVEP